MKSNSLPSVRINFNNISKIVQKNIVDVISNCITPAEGVIDESGENSFTLYPYFFFDENGKKNKENNQENERKVVYSRSCDFIFPLNDPKKSFFGISIFKCWNCGCPDHDLNNCPFPRESEKIETNKRLYDLYKTQFFGNENDSLKGIALQKALDGNKEKEKNEDENFNQIEIGDSILYMDEDEIIQPGACSNLPEKVRNQIRSSLKKLKEFSKKKKIEQKEKEGNKEFKEEEIIEIKDKEENEKDEEIINEDTFLYSLQKMKMKKASENYLTDDNDYQQEKSGNMYPNIPVRVQDNPYSLEYKAYAWKDRFKDNYGFKLSGFEKY